MHRRMSWRCSESAVPGWEEQAPHAFGAVVVLEGGADAAVAACGLRSGFEWTRPQRRIIE
jgi:hypothetical protein